jgi:O-antigen/teichoic acid export membrane protein
MTSRVAPRLLKAAGLNATLRVVSLVSKLALIVYLGKHLSVEDMAIYGLLTTSVGIAVTVLGLEFYAFSTREILGAGAARRAGMLRDQLVFYLIGYALLFPLALPIFVWDVLPWSLAAAFYALAVLEHIGQETSRLFNTLFRPVLGTALFFLRSAAWGIGLMAVGLVRPEWNTVGRVAAAWIAGAAISVALSAWELRRMHWSEAPLGAVNWSWIRRGLLIATPFMISAASYRIIELADRYLIHFMLSDSAVGVYSFYGTLANAIPAVIGAGITSVLTPRIIEAYQTGRLDAYRTHLRTLSISASATALAAVPLGFIGIAWIQRFTGKPEYAAELATCFVLLLSTAVAVIAQIPGVALYARKDDRALLIAVVLGAGLNTVLNLIFIPQFGIIGAAWATTLAYAAMGVYQLRRAMTVAIP